MKQRQLAKLTAPRLHSAVRRERLFRLLDKRVRKPVVWVCGPPGSGKSTLVESYLEARKLKTCWFQVDEGDRDPATFFYYLNALAKTIAGRRKLTLPFLTPEYLADIPGFARRYFRDFFNLLTEQAVVVFDNCQDAASETLHQILREACQELPEALTLLFISRGFAPEELARTQTSGQMLLINAADLRLTAPEARAIARSRKVTGADVDQLTQQVDGWVAGLVLMLSSAMGANAAQRTLSHEELFAYFAGEALARAKPELQSLLLKTCLLPEVTASMAEQLTGNGQAGRLLDSLYRGQYFTDRRTGEETAYQYHDLFREFLLSRFDQAFPPQERAELLKNAASILESRGNLTEAVDLLKRAQDWSTLSALVLAHARALVEAGRWRTLQTWFEDFPESMVTPDTWLQFWRAVAHGNDNSKRAYATLEQCYDAFKTRDDGIGQLAIANAVFDLALTDAGGHGRILTWARRIAEILPHIAPCRETIRGWRTVVFAFTLGDFGHPSLARGAATLEQALFKEDLDDYDLLWTGAILLVYCWPTANIDLLDRICGIVDPVASKTRCGPLARLMWHYWRSMSLLTIPRWEAAKKDALIVIDIGREFRLDAVTAYGLDVYISATRHHGAFAEAEAALAEFKVLTERRLDWMRYAYSLQLFSLHVRKGETHAAYQVLQSLESAAAEIGQAEIGIFLRLSKVSVLAELGQIGAAKTLLSKESALAKRLPLLFTEATRLLTAAHLRWLQHDVPGALELFSQALDESDKPGRLGYMGSPQLAILCAEALDAGWTDVRLSKLIRCFNLPPPHNATTRWPYPVRLSLLGARQIRIDDKPLVFSRKTPRRLLLLLDTLVCAKHDGFSKAKLISLLWDDLEGGAAEEALKIAIRRLRNFLQNADAVEIHQARVRLNPNVVWVDVWAFDANCRKLDKADDPALRAQTLELYRGQFLEQDLEAAHLIAERERLRALFMQQVERHGQWLEKQGNWPDAIALYESGIAQENLAEFCYCGQMRCYAALGRTAEAHAVYRRLRQHLSIVLGTPPSQAAAALFQSLIQA